MASIDYKISDKDKLKLVITGKLDADSTGRLWDLIPNYVPTLIRELTPDIQLIINPALNPDENALVVFGLRARMAF